MLNHGQRIKELEDQTAQLYQGLHRLTQAIDKLTATSNITRERATRADQLNYSAISMLVCKFLYATEKEVTEDLTQEELSGFWKTAELFRTKGVLESAYDQSSGGANAD